MKLIKYKVNKFRSIKGTEWIELDKLTSFVGINESGKTNLLLALWKFNPADNATNIDLLLDYPRDEYSELDDKNSKREDECFIETIFHLDQSELDTIQSEYIKFKNENNNENQEASESNEESTKSNDQFSFTNHLLIKRNYKGHFYIILLDNDLEPISDDIEDHIGQSAFDKICELIPTFLYYSEYGNLDSDLYLPHVSDNLARIDSLTGKERMKARTLKILFSHLKLNPDEILSLGSENTPNNNPAQKADEDIDAESRNKQERYAKLASASTRLTKQFRDWWSQGNYIFDFNADGYYFRIFVSDDERPERIELESRSKGLQWFFSFFLVFLAESKDSHENCILLLDEPGLSLHPNAQSDLIKFFEQLSNKNQLIYTTHLPFLVDHNNLDRVKAVYTENGLTKISNDLSKADKERKAIQPVNAAIGISASQSLLVGCDIVIVEGVSDQFYLSMIKEYLIINQKFIPNKEMVFIPVGGVKGIKPVVSILQGSQSSLPYVLLDSDVAGKQAQTSLKKNLYSSETDKILETDEFCDKDSSEIEDLLPLELIINCFDRVFRSEDGLEISDIDNTKPLVPQLESFGEKNHLNLSENHGWKAILSKRVKQKFDGDVDQKMEKSWIKLFQTLQN